MRLGRRTSGRSGARACGACGGRSDQSWLVHLMRLTALLVGTRRSDVLCSSAARRAIVDSWAAIVASSWRFCAVVRCTIVHSVANTMEHRARRIRYTRWRTSYHAVPQRFAPCCIPNGTCDGWCEDTVHAMARAPQPAESSSRGDLPAQERGGRCWTVGVGCERCAGVSGA